MRRTSNGRPGYATLGLALVFLVETAAAGEPPSGSSAEARAISIVSMPDCEGAPPIGTPCGNPIGLRLSRPYERGKVPVVLVHGLWSRPESWDPMVAAFEADPSIRRRFQFWTFAYPTGDPIDDSAAHLRAALGMARRELDPSGDDPAFGRLVLVGHSLGGLVSKAVASGQVPGRPPVGRVIFIATPHRGSPLARGLTGRIGLRLFRSSDFGPARLEGGASSIEQLATDHPVLTALDASALGMEAPYHSIIADRGRSARGGRSDGVVPYASSHVGGSASELVVSAGHLCQDHPQVIREVGRILRLHAETPRDAGLARPSSGSPAATARGPGSIRSMPMRLPGEPLSFGGIG